MKQQLHAWALIFIGCMTTDIKDTLLVFQVQDLHHQNVISPEQFSRERLLRALLYLIADDESKLAVASKHLVKKDMATSIVKEVHYLLP